MEFKEQNSCLATETTWPFRPGVVQKSMKLLAGCWWVPRADKYFTLRIKTQQTWWRCLMYCQAQSICLLFYISSLEKAIAPHSSTLAWKTPWTEEPGGLQSMGSLRVRHDWVTSLSCIGEGNGNPLQCFCLENPRDKGAWWAAVYGVTQSQTPLKWLSSHISLEQSYHRAAVSLSEET